ncbi:bacterio-opsin activator domain-containing protein [Halostella sp. PRR32]|uniref:bacterio-opsin activator domain-containing protein n=1 Tax=Halostella sp. PRR32 TaxID=3098147 RepID=UPI002B1D5B51|nr:bacterio-opsin activator domain-containing protein [Halostella sp. PRR32]
MVPNGDTCGSHPDYRILLVGPDEWQDKAGPATARLNGIRVTAVTTAEQARKTLVSDDPVDCVVSAYNLEGTTGIRFSAESIVQNAASAFVLAPLTDDMPPDSGTESEHVTWVVPLYADDAGPTGVGGLRTVLSRERKYTRDRQQAAQFRGVFDNPDQFVAVLATDGTIRSLNEAAATLLNASAETVTGKRIWALPWKDGNPQRRTVQKALRGAADGSYTEFEGVLSPSNGTASVGNEVRLRFRIQPAAGDGGDRLLVQGEMLTERERLEAELRASEELHRVTLNNMTDTVLVTDDEGEFTYVCPNVHFIFGYAAEEIHEFGTIDALLGEELIDPDRLESEGVLTNIECTATDKSGTEHTLLVNVREVSIQGGTRLYSCRDITKRKQRERALTQLQQTSRNLLYAETKAEVANRVTADATTALPNGGIALYHFDGAENTLYPMAVSDPLRKMLGSLPEVSLDQRTSINRAFVEERVIQPDETDVSDDLQPLFTNLDDFAAMSLGEHGVLLAATVDGPFDGVNKEIAELLAATTEAAFDRLDRESELRERDERLQQQNRQLSEINQINEIIREIDQAMVHAETREEIETTVCERLSASDRFAFAWIGESAARNRRLHPREWAGDNQGYLDSISLSTMDDQTLSEPSLQTMQDRSLTVMDNVANQLHEATWCKEAVSRNFNSILSIPLVYDDVLFGTLTVYHNDPNSFSETIRTVFSELGSTIGAAINGIQRKEALRSDSVFRLAYGIRDPSFVLFRLAKSLDCTLEVKSEVTQADETTLIFVTVENASAATVVSEATSLVDVTAGEVIRETENGGLVSLKVRDPFVTSSLATHGATRRTLEASPTGVRLVVEVPDSATIRTVDEMLSGQFTDVELTSQQKQTRPSEPQQELGSLMTERQEEIAQVAYHSGYFDMQRNVSGRDIATTLDISHTAFYDHIRRIEQKFFAALFDRQQQYITVE